MSDVESSNQSVALVYMPWGAVSRGSIAVGILKQCAIRAGFPTDVHYLNMRFAERLGVELYEKISASSAFYPEWFFSCALFGPDGMGLMKNAWDDLLSTPQGELMTQRLTELVGGTADFCQRVVKKEIPEFIDECLNDVDWSKYKVVGFSATFAQTLSSLLLAKRIKERHPDVLIVFGGANADSEMGFELVKAFEWVDYVVHGEAEETFPRLLQNIRAGLRFEQLPGVSFRRGAEAVAGFGNAGMVVNLNESPIPDYTDYFREVERTGTHKRVRPKLSFESSRGCWWGAKQHCTFCGLNGNTMAFRKKSAERVYDEIIQLAGQYRCLTLNAADNILDMDYFKELLPKLAEADLDLSIFYEVKSNLSNEQVRKLSSAGITKIQPGIESFNTELLRLMRKGVTAIQNVQLLRWCFEFGIDPSWNILYGFPGERSDQYKELPHIFRLLSHLRPPVGISPVIFERFSPYHFEREKFKLKLEPIPHYRMLYPEHLVDYNKIAYYYDGHWDDRVDDPQEYIRPTLEAYQEWLRYWRDGKVFFYYEKGPGFLTLHDNRPTGPGRELRTRRLNLNELQAKVYLYCDEIRSLKAIQQMLESSYEKSPGEEQIRIMLGQFEQQGLVFREGDRYLSLAVRKRPVRKFNDGPGHAE